jgi:transcription antitermination factor NusG
MVTTMPSCEAIVAEQLRRFFAVTSILFRRRARCVYRGHVVERLYPAYPRYLFVQPEHAYRVRDLLPRITSVVGTPEGPWLTSDKEIDERIARSDRLPDGGLAFPLPAIPEPFSPGEVLLVTGAHMFSGKRVIYQHLTDDQHVCALVDMFGRKVNLDLDLRDVEKYEPPVWKKRHRRFRRRRRQERTLNSSPIAVPA